MYQLRIPNETMLTDLQTAIQKNRTAYSVQQIKISNGKKYINKSENPIETNEASTIKINNEKTAQWTSNVNRVQGWEQTTDSVLQSILSVMHRANELMVQVEDGTRAASGRESLAVELNGIIEELVQLGNSNYLDTPIFGGTKTSNDPFTVTRNADGDITAVEFLNAAPGVDPETQQRQIDVSETSTMKYGLIGSGSNDCADYDMSVFQFQSLEETAPGVWGQVDVDTFETLIALRDQLANNENVSTEYPLRIQRALDNVTEMVIENSSSQKKFDVIEENLGSIEQSAVNRLSEVEDLDMAAAISNLYDYENVLTASLQMVTRMNSMSIINFI